MIIFFFFSSRRRHTRFDCDWSSDVCSSDLRLYQKAATDQYGRYLLRGIAPGEYKIFAWEEVEDGAWEDPDYLTTFEDRGQKISVQEADTKTIDIVAIRTKALNN